MPAFEYAGVLESGSTGYELVASNADDFERNFAGWVAQGLNKTMLVERMVGLLQDASEWEIEYGDDVLSDSPDLIAYRNMAFEGMRAYQDGSEIRRDAKRLVDHNYSRFSSTSGSIRRKSGSTGAKTASTRSKAKAKTKTSTKRRC